MTPGGGRRERVGAALRRIIPCIPGFDFTAILDHAMDSRGLKTASPEAAAWLSAIAYVRHTYTDYDDLLAEGYDDASARHFCLDAINGVLADWGCRKTVSGDDRDAS